MSLLATTLASIHATDAHARNAARQRIAQLTMPPRALGRLLELAEDLSAATGAMPPPVARKTVVVMAGDHGVCAEGISAFPAAVTGLMVANFAHGGAGINVLARQAGARVVVVDMGAACDLSALVSAGQVIDRKVAAGTANLAVGPAMTRAQAVQAIEAGIAIANDLAATTDVFATGEMGIGNTTPASAITAVLTGHPVEDVTGRGTGLDDHQRQHKVAVITRALNVNQPDPSNGLDVLTKVGGFEIAGLAGLCLGAAALRKPVVVDGFISTSAALVAQALCPVVSEYLIAAHQSVEPGHVAALHKLGKTPLMDLDLRLGEGTGAALAFHLVEASARILSEMATFEQAGI